jgi:hypothetical protein
MDTQAHCASFIRHYDQVEGTMPNPTPNPTTDQEWADYLTDVLKLLSDHGERLPGGAPLRDLIEDTCESLGVLAGYFADGVDGNSDQLFDQANRAELERSATVKAALHPVGLWHDE